ncbi:MAG: acyl-CoA thioesterase [Lachnospiraceae bacterium]|nr:acyl-CoA thioesterase [Lachnospiraceae bacterium]
METVPYRHIVRYYETDRMGITHHSNYIRFMEEARVDFLKQLGWDYGKLESMGVVSPVVKVECQYKVPTTFEDELRIKVLVKECSGIRIRFLYQMKNQHGVMVCTAESEHCFVSAEGKIIRVDKEFPEFFADIKEKSEEHSL